MNNTIMRKIDVTGTYQPLVADSLVATVTISCPPTNAAAVQFKGDDGSDVPWLAGEWHTLHRVDLAEIQIKGTVGDVVSIVGGIW